MTELLLICGIGVLGIAFATTAARWLLQRPVGDAELSRVAALVSSAAVRHLRRQNVVAIGCAGVLGAMVFLVYGVAYQTDVVNAVSPREHGVCVTLSYLLGAAFGLLAAWVASWAGRSASARVAAGVSRSLDDSLQVAIRAGAVSGVVALALALLGIAGLFIGIYLYAGGLNGDLATALAAAPRIPLLLVGFGLGAAFVALLGQLGGGFYGKVADIGADVTGVLEERLSEEGADNPATVADLVGDNVGDGAARAGCVFAAVVAELLAAMLVAALVYRNNPDLPSATAVVLFPLVARTFSLLAAWFGVMVVRTDDTEVPMSALARGLYVCTLLYAVGAVGCAKWLLGVHWIAFGSCAVLGTIVSLVILFVVQYYSEQRYRPVRALAEAARGGPTIATLRGMFTAVESTFLLATISLVGVMAAHYVGSMTGLASGGLLGIAIAVGGMLGNASYVLAMDTMGSVADTAGGIIGMTVGAERPDVRARARLLDAVGTTAQTFAKSLVTVASTAACLLLAAVFMSEAWHHVGRQTVSVDLSSPALYIAMLAGPLLVLAFIWITLRCIIASSRDLLNELRGNLGREDKGAGNARRLQVRLGIHSQTTSEGSSQLACAEIVSRIALRGMMAPAISGVGFALCVGVVLRLFIAQDTVSAAEAVVALLVVATIAGALVSLLFISAGSSWDNAKKYIETGAHGGTSERGTDNPTYVAAVIGDTIGDPLKGVIGPATPTLINTIAALALVFLPFFI